jgi:hypothetical protein
MYRGWWQKSGFFHPLSELGVSIALNVLYVTSWGANEKAVHPFLDGPSSENGGPESKRPQTAASDPKKRRPIHISEREIDLEPPVRPLAASLRRLTPIIKPDQDLDIQLSNVRRTRIADKDFEFCKHEFLTILNFALFHRRTPTPRHDGTIDRSRYDFLAGRFHDPPKHPPPPEIVVKPEYRFREPSLAELLDQVPSVPVSEAICAMTGIVEYEDDANPEMNHLRERILGESLHDVRGRLPRERIAAIVHAPEQLGARARVLGPYEQSEFSWHRSEFAPHDKKREFHRNANVETRSSFRQTRPLRRATFRSKLAPLATERARKSRNHKTHSRSSSDAKEELQCRPSL